MEFFPPLSKIQINQKEKVEIKILIKSNNKKKLPFARTMGGGLIF